MNVVRWSDQLILTNSKKTTSIMYQAEEKKYWTRKGQIFMIFMVVWVLVVTLLLNIYVAYIQSLTPLWDVSPLWF